MRSPSSVKAVILVVTYLKDKVVNLTPTLADPSVDRQQKDGTQISVPCPLCVAPYNNFVHGGIDLADQHERVLSCSSQMHKEL